MEFLLPHKYKRIGSVMFPLSFALWVFMQRGYVTKILIQIFGEANGGSSGLFHNVNMFTAMISFFSFLGGIYLVTFSKEKVEDEMVQRTRLDSFQFAALVQISVTILGFVSMLFAGEPQKEGMLIFIVVLLLLFWLSFISRFNYILHFKLRHEE